ncbi:hypothetical protein V5799_014942 [Amblyomma americanum]|uniref:Uncharacterized protein n=1 Tax=Amblyomma americanum TaxID=6943 RepID=A0AAQ4E1K6_AMBAM
MSSVEDRVAAESSACSGVNSAENPAPPSCPPKKNACDDVEDVFLSIGPSTPSGDDYLAEKRHLQDLARYLDAFTVAEHSTAAAAVRPHQTPGDASTVEEWLEGSSRKALSWRPTAVPCTPQEAAARDDAVATPSTVRAIDDSAVKREVRARREP